MAPIDLPGVMSTSGTFGSAMVGLAHPGRWRSPDGSRAERVLMTGGLVEAVAVGAEIGFSASPRTGRQTYHPGPAAIGTGARGPRR
jgi:hypothetical protein